MSIHSRIKERRKALFGSHEAFGKAVNVSWQTVQQWEKEGGTAPNRSRIDKVAAALGVTPEWLLYGPADERAQERGGDPLATPIAPPWCAPEAFRLLDLYYRCDPRGRADIMGAAQALVDAEIENKARDKL